MVEIGHRLHDLHAAGFVFETLVDLQERHDLLLRPEILGAAQSLDLAIHGPLEEDRTENPVSVEGFARDHARAHGVDQIEHLGIGRVLRLGDSVETQGLGGAATALIEGGDEALAGA